MQFLFYPILATKSDPKTDMNNYLILFAIYSILIGCGTPTAPLFDQPISAMNYQNSIEIKKLDKAYYSGKYKGKNLKCAENNGFESCPEQFLTFRQDTTGEKWSGYFKDINGVFKIEEPVEAEAFQAKMSKSGHSGEILGKKMNEFLLLALADLSLQRGFKYLVKLKEINSIGCMSNPRADTFGTFDPSGTFYRGTTTLGEDNYCHSLSTLEVLMLNDREELAKGLFYTTYTTKDSDKFFIEDLLYVGAPGFFPPAYGGVEKFGDLNIITVVPIKAWEKVYDASGLSRDLRLKYGVTGIKPYTFEDERESKMKRKAGDVMDKNLVK